MSPIASTQRRLGARITAAVVAAGLATVSVMWAAAPAGAAPTSDAGLYGVQDPTYDGVYRQSLTILALHAVSAPVDPAAITWLKQQQCADGSWTSYRADTTVACVPANEDSNATGMAIQALTAIGQLPGNAVTALRGFQMPDGGFYSNEIFGAAASDANSTGIALSALVSAGVDPATVTDGGKNGFDFLRTLQIACGDAGGGAYDFMPESPLHANDYATVQAALGMQAVALPVAEPATIDPTAPACPASITDGATSAQAAVSYLAGRLQGNGGLIPSSFGGGSDYTSTVNAVLALAAARAGGGAVDAAVAALEANVHAYTVDGDGHDVPAALAGLMLVAHATGADPTSFGGADLVTAAAATLRLPAAPPSPSPTPTPSTTPTPAPTQSAQAPVSTPTHEAPTLPFTGAPTLGLAAGAVVLLAGGTALVMVARRRDGERQS